MATKLERIDKFTENGDDQFLYSAADFVGACYTRLTECGLTSDEAKRITRCLAKNGVTSLLTRDETVVNMVKFCVETDRMSHFGDDFAFLLECAFLVRISEWVEEHDIDGVSFENLRKRAQS